MGGLTDLISDLHTRDTAELIFGKPVEVTANSLDLGNGAATLVEIDIGRSKIEAEQSKSEFSVWTITFAKPLVAQNVSYVRFRLHATAIGRCWTWQRSWLERKRIILDFRVADIRELWYLDNKNSLRHSIHPIRCIRLFLIVPAKFRLAVASPNPYYSRVLEGYAWKSYLKRSPKLFGKEKLLIHQWRNDLEINISSPLRIFADLDDPRTLNFGPNVILGLLVLLSIGFLIPATEKQVLQAATHWSNMGYSALIAHFRTLMALGVLGAIGAIASTFERGKKALHWAQQFLVKLERIIYRLS